VSGTELTNEKYFPLTPCLAACTYYSSIGQKNKELHITTKKQRHDEPLGGRQPAPYAIWELLPGDHSAMDSVPPFASRLETSFIMPFLSFRISSARR